MSIRRFVREHGPASPGFVLLLLAAAALALLAGCSSDSGGTRPNPPGTLTADCVGCHTDKDMLVATAAADTTAPPASSGEG